MKTDSDTPQEADGAGSSPSSCSASSSGLLVSCQDCGTRYEMGNGQLAAAEKRGHYHHLGHCPKCDRKTWSEPFPVRPMTRAEIAAAFHSPQNANVEGQADNATPQTEKGN